MAIFKCKMCGGALEVMDGATTGECQYCGTTQTLPKLNDDKKANMYDRANHFRRNNEFDKARAIYEQILNEDNTDAESYWSIILCQYGIEYVEDPVTHKRVPTVNRAQFTSVFADENYKKAIEHADVYQKSIYEEEAKAIDEIQKGILAISQKEEPFDVFICYKETDNNGRRTPDSVLANDLYHQLTQEGFKVFFSRITLEDKLGSAYEPYIFAALNSAKVMVVVGTKPEYFNAVWVKNEWSRYLSLIKSGSNKILIPAYRDMDPYDLPEEFSHLQAQDMSKLGFMQDLIRGIKKLAGEETKVEQSTPVVTPVAPQSNADPLLERVFMFLEDGDWDSADEYCEKVLDIDPENAQAYVGKLLVELKVNRKEDLEDQEESFSGSNNYEKALRFADDELKEELRGYVEYIDCRNDNARKEKIYNGAKEFMQKAKSEEDYIKAAGYFESIIQHLDSAELAEKCHERAKTKLNEKVEFDKLFKAYKVAVQIEEINKRLGTIELEITSLSSESLNAFFFEKKKKREIAENIAALESEKQLLLEDIALLQKKNNEDSVCIKTSQTIRDELDSFEYGKNLLEIFDSIQNFKKGEHITFGAFMQDYNNTFLINPSHKEKDIEWIVLDVKDEKALVISKNALNCLQYNTSQVDVTWESCTLRKWLNNDFIHIAFSDEERNMIETVTVTADKNPLCETNQGNETQDKVFLLSIKEAEKYFVSSNERVCKPTAYAEGNGAYTKKEFGCQWWLRSNGDKQKCAATVFHGGSLCVGGQMVDSYFHGVRPALWIDLNSYFSKVYGIYSVLKA